MSKRFMFLISFILVLGLSGVVQAGYPIDDPNYNLSFELMEDGNFVSCHGGLGTNNDAVMAWDNDWLPASSTWTGVDIDCCAPGACDDCRDWHVFPDGNVVCYIDAGTWAWQVFDPNEDGNVIITEGRQYTATFDAFAWPTDLIASFFYPEDLNYPDVNQIVVASRAIPLDVNYDANGLNEWQYDEQLKFISEAGQSYIGKNLGLKFFSPMSGGYIWLDHVRLEWDYATYAYDPYPEDGETDVPKNVTLNWKPGTYTQTSLGHLVYFGTSYAEVYDANTNDSEYKGVQSPNSYNPGTLELGKSYCWRIDEVNSAHTTPPPPVGPWKGDVWSFEVTGYATNPQPADGEVDVPFLDLTLYWTAGSEATSHGVYFGTDYNDVDNADTSTSGIYRGSRTDPNYPVPESSTGLTVGQTYYWRIDESSATKLLKGKIWSFTIGAFLVVDDFDGYANQNALYAVWDDYWVNYSGAQIYLETDANYIRDGNSLRFSYDNSNYKTGSYMDALDPAELEVGADWTVGGVKALTLYFMGDPCNVIDTKYPGADRMWAELEDTSTNAGVVKHTDANEMAEAEWHEWNIALKGFSDAGVTLSNLDRVTIGIGGPKGGQSLATKVIDQIWIDDMRLYPPRCMPEYAQVVGNMNGDCIVDACDLGLFGADWLVSDMNAPASPPAQPPEVWYRFDDGPGSTVVSSDGSWSGYDIAISSPNAEDEPAWDTNVAPAVEVCDPNYSMIFDGVNDWLDIPNTPASQFAGTQNMTIIGWVKRNGLQASYDGGIVVSVIASGSRHATGLAFNRAGDSLNYFWNEDYWQWDPGLTVPDNTWAIMAVAVEPTKATAYVFNSSTQALTYYTNVAEHAALEEFGSDDDIYIGSAGKGIGSPGSPVPFLGLLDDIRLYNKTLTIGEIMGIAGLTGEVYVPNPSNANFAPVTPTPTGYDPNNPDIVNFVDYEVLAKNWLAEYLWPPD